NTDITVTFNLDLDISTLNEYNILVFGSESGAHIVTIGYFSPTRTVNVNPVDDFSSYETVEVYLSENISSTGGITLGQNFTFEFTTGSCCVDLTGNTDCSEIEEPDISDITRLIDFLYLSHDPLCCLPEADVNGSGGGPDISDITYLIDHLYLSHKTLKECP
ncbi:MAG: Ig-like domain-containing protein, partial [candidate division Zixibacteria bacterium]|nr:Ig-like domain-containing protein [candidate division Zixibacteria bacterium]